MMNLRLRDRHGRALFNAAYSYGGLRQMAYGAQVPTNHTIVTDVQLGFQQIQATRRRHLNTTYVQNEQLCRAGPFLHVAKNVGLHEPRYTVIPYCDIEGQATTQKMFCTETMGQRSPANRAEREGGNRRVADEARQVLKMI